MLKLIDSPSFLGDWVRLNKSAKYAEIVKNKFLLSSLSKLEKAKGPLTKIQVEQALLRLDREKNW